VKVCIVGAGAIGGLLGTRLAQSGINVSALARGATAASLREHGFRLQTADGLATAPVTVVEGAATPGPQDLVVVAVKGPSLRAVAPAVAALSDERTVVLTAMNGVPWWFFDGLGGTYEGTRLATVDPDGAIAAAIPRERVVGAVVHLACSAPAPGLVRHGVGNRLIVGEPAGGTSARVERIAAMFRSARFDVDVSPRIQADIWYKLWGNMTMNPVSAFTGATLDRILDDPLANAFCLSVMREAAAIGTAIGCPIGETGEARNQVTRRLGAVKTSMLQDVEAGRPVEIDALLSAVREIGTRTGIATPNLDALLGLARLHARTHGLYPT